MFYVFELGPNTAKDKSTVDHSQVTRWLKKFRAGFKNFDDKTKSNRFKSVNSESVLQAV